MPNPKTVEELYKAIAPFYTKGISNFLFEIEEPIIKGILPKLGGLRVLDVGCGSGRWTSKFVAAGGEVIGVDKSKVMLKFAKKRAKKAKFLRMDARKLKFTSNSFDFVFESLMLVHVPNWKKAVKEMIRVCKPCGTILISDFNGARLFGAPTDIPFSVSKTKIVHFPISAIMPSEMIEFALKNGCELIEFKEPKQKLPKKYIQRFHYQPPLQIIMLRKKH
jgi:ubiquinone/menaquinone biosynthesis C-methylase UbiE